MANTKLKLKKSSVAGRIPVAGDLEYGELAINYRDGKLYYKDNANAIQAFNDSSSTITLITNLVDSDYVLARAGNAGTDSASVINLIDSDYVQARVESGVIGDANTVVLNEYTGDSSTSTFALTHSPTTDQHAIVMVDGVVQQVNNYSLSGSQLTLDEAPVNGAEVEVRTLRMQTGEVTLRDFANYIYQPSSATTTFSGADINAQTLSYDVNKLDVYKNGARLVHGLDYTATNGTSVTLLTDYPVDSSDTVTVSSFGKAYLIDRGVVPAEQDTPTAATQYVADTYSASLYRTSKYIIQLEHDSDNKYHSTEVLLTHDGTSVYMTEYGDVKTDSSLGTIDADISGGNVRLLVTPEYNNTSIKTQRITVGA